VAVGACVATAQGFHSLLQIEAQRPIKAIASEGDEQAEPGHVAEHSYHGHADDVILKSGDSGFVHSFIGFAQRVVQRAGIPISVPDQQAHVYRVSYGETLISCLLGWAVWCAMAFIIVTFCYVRNYVPNSPVGEHPEYTLSNRRFGCFEDCHVCCCSACFPAIRWADTMAQAKILDFWPAFALFSGMAMLNVLLSGGVFVMGIFTVCLGVYFRQELRKKLKMAPVWQFGVVFEDFCYFCWCSCCAIAQEAMVVRQAIQHKKEGFEAPEPEVMDA